LYDARLQLCAVRQKCAGGNEWQRDRETSLRAQEKEVLAGQTCGAVLVTLCLKPLL